MSHAGDTTGESTAGTIEDTISGDTVERYQRFATEEFRGHSPVRREVVVRARTFSAPRAPGGTFPHGLDRSRLRA
ncbi:hypothetical protein [Sphaerisporangium sp. NPDC051011]|uniref:hypothetical protein n=1 Tax=Sphaerisporangium sp. NPDC051011 TaxID=3155792 RepID=UPI0033D3FC66